MPDYDHIEWCINFLENISMDKRFEYQREAIFDVIEVLVHLRDEAQANKEDRQ